MTGTAFRLTLLLLILLILPQVAQQTTARYLLWQPSARAYAMGGTGVALSDAAFGTWQNPATLAKVRGIATSGALVKPFPFFDNSGHAYGAAAIRIAGIGVLAGSFNGFWRTRQLQTDVTGEIIAVDGNKPSIFKPTHWHAKLSYAVNLSENTLIGVGLGLLRTKLSSVRVSAEQEGGKTWSALVDAGFLVSNLLPGATIERSSDRPPVIAADLTPRKPSPGLAFGVSVRNLGPKISYIDDAQKDSPPGMLAAGLAYRPLISDPLDVLLTADFGKEIFESSAIDEMHFGGEFTLLNIFALRGGYWMSSAEGGKDYWTYGIGIITKYAQLSIARYDRSIMPTWHFDSSMTLEFPL